MHRASSRCGSSELGPNDPDHSLKGRFASMRLLARVMGGIGLLALILAGLVVAPTVASASSHVVGHVYVNDNTAGTNTIGGFDQHADGTLTPLAGAPFSAGGDG